MLSGTQSNFTQVPCVGKYADCGMIVATSMDQLHMQVTSAPRRAAGPPWTACSN